ncbi:hypothetical protein NONO_c17870 [Nocardia nova SH22a]|uniref:Phage major tail protein n=1 Tax=Nocardia nova SH22a TaxID=1415166 RepID=W5TBJ9_9NOCA|nr:hypothetical protein [Nocardia nova]AHH16587.1 hypothetical protein NONO_c17870 [Nocardia nova SH22a]
MARDPDNAKIWQDAHVYVALGVTTRPAVPADIDAAFATGWEEVGILDGDAGFAEDRSSDETKAFGWGIGLIKIGAKNFELARKMTMLEDNETTQAIVNPGSTATAIMMPKPVLGFIAFETASDVGDLERLISVKPARLWVPANNRNESDVTKSEVNIGLFADGTGKIFDRQVGTPGEGD